MKLNEFLENASYKYIKIGTLGGSFFYCGELEKLDTKRVDRDYRKFIMKRLNYHKNLCDKYKTQGITIRENTRGNKVDKISRYGRYMTVEEFVNLRIAEEEKYYENYLKKKNNYKSLAKREIKDIYDSVLHDDCIIVIVDGFEHGNVYDLFEMED